VLNSRRSVLILGGRFCVDGVRGRSEGVCGLEIKPYCNSCDCSLVGVGRLMVDVGSAGGGVENKVLATSPVSTDVNCTGCTGTVDAEMDSLIGLNKDECE
jgi:hypothetical protein